MVSEVPKMIVLCNFATKSKLQASLAVWRNFLPYIFQGGLQPGSPSRRAAPVVKYRPTSKSQLVFAIFFPMVVAKIHLYSVERACVPR